MHRTKQFQTTPRKRDFFDRKVLTYGYSRTVALGKIIPQDWTYLRITVVNIDQTNITIKLTKLMGKTPIAPNPKTNQTNR